MTAWRRTRWTLWALIVVAAVSAPFWHRLWDTQDHGLRVWLGIYCFAMAGALTTAFDVFVRTRKDGPSYEPLWAAAWPMWSIVWFAFVAFWILAFFGGLIFLAAVPVIALAYLPYRFLAKGIRESHRGASDVHDLADYDAWLGR